MVLRYENDVSIYCDWLAEMILSVLWESLLFSAVMLPNFQQKYMKLSIMCYVHGTYSCKDMNSQDEVPSLGGNYIRSLPVKAIKPIKCGSLHLEAVIESLLVKAGSL